MNDLITVYLIGLFISAIVCGFYQAKDAKLALVDVFLCFIWPIAIPIGLFAIPLIIGRAIFYTVNQFSRGNDNAG